MAYSEKVVDHYENPRNVGSFEKGDEDVGTGMVGAPACGDVMKLQIKVNPQTGVIEDARFKTYGCGSAIASSSLVTEWVKGKTLDQAAALKNSEIAEELVCHPSKFIAPSWLKTPSKQPSKTIRKNTQPLKWWMLEVHHGHFIDRSCSTTCVALHHQTRQRRGCAFGR